MQYADHSNSIIGRAVIDHESRTRGGLEGAGSAKGPPGGPGREGKENQWARIGSDLNQIARWANIHKEDAEVVDEFEKTTWAGLEPDRYAWSAVEHREAGGRVHVHVLTAR